MAGEVEGFVRDLRTIIARAQAELANKLANGGGIASFEEYRHLTGVNKGMEQAADLAYQLMKQRDLADEGGDLPPMPPDDKTPGKRNKGGRR